MTTTMKTTWPLLFGMLLIMMGNGLQGTLLGVRGSMESISSEAMGYIISAYFVGFLGGSKFAPQLIASVGHVRSFAALGSLASAALLLFSVWVEPWFWFVLRLMVGFCIAAIYVIAESWLNNIATNDSRGKTLSLYMMTQTGGIMVGQQLLNLSDPGGYVLFIVTSVLLSVSFAPILLSSSPAPIFESAKSMRLTELLQVSPLGIVGLLLAGGVFSAFGMFSVYAVKIDLTVAQISILISTIYLGSLIMQYPIGWLSDRIDRRKLIVIVALMGGAGASLILLIGHTYPLLIVACFIVGGSANPLYSLLVSYTNDYLEVDQMASASGGMLFVNGLGAMGGAIIVGYMMNWFGPPGFFLFIMVLLLAIAAYALYRMTQRQSISVDDQSPYIPLSSRSSPVIRQVAAEYVADEVEEMLAEEDSTADTIAQYAEDKSAALEVAATADPDDDGDSVDAS